MENDVDNGFGGRITEGLYSIFENTYFHGEKQNVNMFVSLKVSALAQIEFYCSKNEELSHSHPNVAAVIEKCALEAVTSLCQV